MKDTLQGLLLGYIRDNNPELLLQLTNDDALHAWVCDKIREIEVVLQDAKPSPDESDFMHVFASDLQPSRFRFVSELFKLEFTDVYERMQEAGTLHYELINMVSACHCLFEDMPLVEGMENPQLDHAVAEAISEYLQVSYE
jgi:hypothetical protein